MVRTRYTAALLGTVIALQLAFAAAPALAEPLPQAPPPKVTATPQATPRPSATVAPSATPPRIDPNLRDVPADPVSASTWLQQNMMGAFAALLYETAKGLYNAMRYAGGDPAAGERSILYVDPKQVRSLEASGIAPDTAGLVPTSGDRISASTLSSRLPREITYSFDPVQRAATMVRIITATGFVLYLVYGLFRMKASLLGGAFDLKGFVTRAVWSALVVFLSLELFAGVIEISNDIARNFSGPAGTPLLMDLFNAPAVEAAKMHLHLELVLPLFFYAISYVILVVTLFLRVLLLDTLYIVGPLALFFYVFDETTAYARQWTAAIVGLLLSVPFVAGLLEVAGWLLTTSRIEGGTRYYVLAFNVQLIFAAAALVVAAVLMFAFCKAQAGNLMSTVRTGQSSTAQGGLFSWLGVGSIAAGMLGGRKIGDAPAPGTAAATPSRGTSSAAGPAASAVPPPARASSSASKPSSGDDRPAAPPSMYENLGRRIGSGVAGATGSFVRRSYLDPLGSRVKSVGAKIADPVADRVKSATLTAREQITPFEEVREGVQAERTALAKQRAEREAARRREKDMAKARKEVAGAMSGRGPAPAQWDSLRATYGEDRGAIAREVAVRYARERVARTRFEDPAEAEAVLAREDESYARARVHVARGFRDELSVAERGEWDALVKNNDGDAVRMAKAIAERELKSEAVARADAERKAKADADARAKQAAKEAAEQKTATLVKPDAGGTKLSEEAVAERRKLVPEAGTGPSITRANKREVALITEAAEGKLGGLSGGTKVAEVQEMLVFYGFMRPAEREGLTLAELQKRARVALEVREKK